MSVFAGEKTTSLAKAIETELPNKKLLRRKIKSDDTTLLKKFEYEAERRYSLSERSAGSIYKVKLDDTHPYAFGMGKEWFIMKRNSRLSISDNRQVISDIYLKKNLLPDLPDLSIKTR